MRSQERFQLLVKIDEITGIEDDTFVAGSHRCFGGCGLSGRSSLCGCSGGGLSSGGLGVLVVVAVLSATSSTASATTTTSTSAGLELLDEFASSGCLSGSSLSRRSGLSGGSGRGLGGGGFGVLVVVAVPSSSSSSTSATTATTSTSACLEFL